MIIWLFLYSVSYVLILQNTSNNAFHPNDLHTIIFRLCVHYVNGLDDVVAFCSFSICL